MKRFLPLILVVVLVAAMAVPAMAAEDTVLVSGTWVFNDEVFLPSTTIKQTVSFDSEGGNPFKQFVISSAEMKYIRTDGATVYAYSNHWGFPQYKSVTFTSEQEVSAQFYTWLSANAVKVVEECDGSTCPATDANHDDICDDCGLPMAFSLRDDTTYDYNGFVLPVLPVMDYDAYWVMFPSGDTVYRLVAASKPFSVESGEVYVYEQTSLVFFAAGHSSSEWSQYSTQNITSKYSVGDAESIVWASHNIANKETGDLVFNGDVNFRDPLWMEMEQVTQGEMTGLAQTMGGTMKVLVLCGVGLMACLVVLSLFGRRSLIFRR